MATAEPRSAVHDQSDPFDAIILGCGVSGLILARTLTDQGKRVLCLDEYAHAGGNHITDIVDGMEFDIGSIYFHERDLHFDYFPELRDVCIECSVRLAKVGRDKSVSPYPFSMKSDVLDRGPVFLARSVASWAADQFLVVRRRSAAARVRRKLGLHFFRESGLYNYMERLLGLPPEEVSHTFVERRMQWVVRYSPTKELIARAIRPFIAPPPKAPRNRTLFRPPGGFSEYYAVAVDRLRRDGASIVLGEQLQDIARGDDGQFAVRNQAGKAYRAHRLISTLPIARACDLAGLKRPRLDAVTLLTLRVAYRGNCRADGDVVFNFHPDGPWKRITLMNNIYGSVDGWSYMSVECPFPNLDVPDDRDVFENFASHVRSLELFDGELKYLGCRQLNEAYPRLAIGYEEEQRRILEELQALGIESAGRQGQFDYIPHSSIAARLIQERFGQAATSLPRGELRGTS